MVQLSTQSAPEFSDIVDSSGLPHKLLQILTLGAASGSIPKFHRHIHPNKAEINIFNYSIVKLFTEFLSVLKSIL